MNLLVRFLGLLLVCTAVSCSKEQKSEVAANPKESTFEVVAPTIASQPSGPPIAPAAPIPVEPNPTVPSTSTFAATSPNLIAIPTNVRSDGNVFVIHPASGEELPLVMTTPFGANGQRVVRIGNLHIVAPQWWEPGMPVHLLPELYSRAFGIPITTPQQLPVTITSQATTATAQPLTLTDPDTAIALPALVTNVAVGGKGRYLLLTMKDLRTLAVFDVKQGKIRKNLSIDAEYFLVAAGATRFVVIDPAKQTIMRWNYEQLETPEMELVTKEITRRVHAITIGRDSEGPIGVLDSGYNPPLHLFDLTSLTRLPITKKGTTTTTGASSSSQVSAFDDGQTFYVSSVGSALNIYRLRGSELEAESKTISLRDGTYRTAGNGLYEISERDIAFRDGTHMKPMQVLAADGAILPWVKHFAPASPAGFWFGLGHPSPNESALGISMNFGTDRTAFETIYLKGGGTSFSVRDFPQGRRVFYNAEEKSLVAITAEPSQLLIKSLDIESMFAKGKRDVLVVTSVPPSTYAREEKYSYAIRATSSRGGIAYRLESGPPGMTISPTGVVEWLPPLTSTKSPSAIVSVTDRSGAQIFHNINLTLTAGTTKLEKTMVDGEAVTTAVTSDRTEIQLPGRISRYAIGGSGRYVVASLSNWSIAVIDVKERKLLKIIPNKEGSDGLTAGATKFVIHNRGENGFIARYSLTTLERELSIPLPEQPRVQFISMGSGSEGPILTALGDRERGEHEPFLLDLRTLKPPVGSEKFRLDEDGRKREVGFQVAAASNGRLFGSWQVGHSPTGLYSIGVAKNQLRVIERHTDVGAVIPNADGTLFYTWQGIYTNQGESIGKRAPIELMPSETGNFYLSWPSYEGKDDEQVVSLHMQGSEKALMKLPQIDIFKKETRELWHSNAGRLGDLWYLHRPRLLPVSDAIIHVGTEPDKLTIYHVSIDRILAGASGDNLIVKSTPPTVYKPGAAWAYQIVPVSKSGPVEFRLDSAPEGMTLSPLGLLKWNPGITIAGDQAVIVSLIDGSKKEIFHTFKIASDPNADPSMIVSVTPSTGSVETAPIIATTPSTTGAAEPAGPANSIRFPSAVDDIVVGGGGRFLVAYLKSLRQVAVVDLTKRKITKLLPFDDEEVVIAAGATKFVVSLPARLLVQRYNLADAQRELNTTVLNPIRFMSMGLSSEGPILFSTSDDTYNSDDEGGFLDLRTLKPVEYTVRNQRPNNSAFRYGNRSRLNADGTTMAVDKAGVTLLGRAIQLPTADGSIHFGGGVGLPSADGRVIYHDGRMYSLQGDQVGKIDDLIDADIYKVGTYLIPAATGPSYLKIANLVQSRSGAVPRTASLHLQGQTIPIITFENFDYPMLDSDVHEASVAQLQLEKKIFLLPDAAMIAVLGGANDELKIRNFNLDDELKKSGVDYFFADSIPPRDVVAGSLLNYQITVKSKQGDLKYRLEAGPERLTVSTTGLVTWQAPPQPDDEERVTIIAIGNSSGREIFHTFKLKVVARTETGIPVATIPTPAGNSAKSVSTPSVVRKWTSSDGAFTIDAKFVELRGTKVALKRANGTEIEVNIGALCQADRDYLQSRSAK